MKIFILEDDAERIKFFSSWGLDKELVIVNNAVDAIWILKIIKFDYLFLDHDLLGLSFVDSSDVNTGAEVCRNITQFNKTANILIHSWNEVGVKNMNDILKDNNHRGEITSAMYGMEDFIRYLTKVEYIFHGIKV